VCRNFGYCVSLFGLIAQHWKPKYFAGNFDDDVGMGEKKQREKRRARECLGPTTMCYDLIRRITRSFSFFSLAIE